MSLFGSFSEDKSLSYGEADAFGISFWGLQDIFGYFSETNWNVIISFCMKLSNWSLMCCSSNKIWKQTTTKFSVNDVGSGSSKFVSIINTSKLVHSYQIPFPLNFSCFVIRTKVEQIINKFKFVCWIFACSSDLLHHPGIL